MRHIPRNPRSKGGTLVETALCLVILCAVLFGLMELGLTLYSYHTISELAREGTRYAIVRGSACKGFTDGSCNANASTIANYVSSLGYLNISPGSGCGSPNTQQSICVLWCTAPSKGAGITCSASGSNSPGNLVQVTVTYPTPLVLPMISSTPVTLSSTSRMVISQ